MAWATATPAWGDTIITLYRIRESLGQASLALYGSPEEIYSMVPFLEAQDFINEVRTVECGDRKSFLYRVWHNDDRDQLRPEIAAAIGVDPNKLHMTHLGKKHWWRPLPVPTQLSLPADAIDWACEYSSDAILVQPYSFHSNSFDKHWPCWWDALEWLAERYEIILVGKRWGHHVVFGDLVDLLPNTTSLVDKAPSMAHVFALASRCQKVVTTSNALAIWCAGQGVPCVTALNSSVNDTRLVFYRAISGPAVTLIKYEDSLDAFQHACCGLVETRS